MSKQPCGNYLVRTVKHLEGHLLGLSSANIKTTMEYTLRKSSEPAATAYAFLKTGQADDNCWKLLDPS
eukprot:scaffold530_cov107-Cylindrotheca_fusiformis.AAC.15